MFFHSSVAFEKENRPLSEVDRYQRCRNQMCVFFLSFFYVLHVGCCSRWIRKSVGKQINVCVVMSFSFHTLLPFFANRGH